MGKHNRSEDEVRKFFDSHDVNDDGEVSLYEFLSTKYWLSAYLIIIVICQAQPTGLTVRILKCFFFLKKHLIKKPTN